MCQLFQDISLIAGDVNFSNHGNMKKKSCYSNSFLKVFTHLYKLFSQNNTLETLLRQRIKQLVHWLIWMGGIYSWLLKSSGEV